MISRWRIEGSSYYAFLPVSDCLTLHWNVSSGHHSTLVWWQTFTFGDSSLGQDAITSRLRPLGSWECSALGEPPNKWTWHMQILTDITFYCSRTAILWKCDVSRTVRCQTHCLSHTFSLKGQSTRLTHTVCITSDQRVLVCDVAYVIVL